MWDQMSDLVPFTDEAGVYVITRSQLETLGIFEAKLLEWTLEEAVRSRPDLEVRVGHLVGGNHHGGVEISWKPRAASPDTRPEEER